MSIDVRPADVKDIDKLLPIFLDMERHYDGEGAVGMSTARFRLTAIFTSLHGVILLGAANGRALGFLSMFEMFPGHQLRPVWYMKELYVLESARGRGVGEALVRHAARIVIDHGGSRLDFTTGRDNSGAQRFYAHLGAQEVPALVLRIDEETLSRLAADENGTLSI